jgi:hypothetical protein
MRVVEVATKVRQWWFMTESNQVVLHDMYGTKMIDISNGKSSIEITDGHHLIKTLETLCGALSVGSLTHNQKCSIECQRSF